MSPQRIHLDDVTPSRWTGGQTWESLLLPADGSYAERRFDLRISTASIEAESSTFTPLPGIDRWLCVDDPVTLTINGVETPLSPGTLLSFRGEDDVTSVGRTRDLNVMARRGVVAPDVALAHGEIEGPCMVVDIPTRDLWTLADGENLTVDRALVVRL